MAVDIASLHIQVDHDSIDGAGRSLSSFSNRAREAEKATDRLIQELRKAFDVQDKLERAFKGLVGTIGGVAAAYLSLEKAMSFMRRGIDFNSSIESARIGMASLITSMVKLGDATGRPLEGMAKYQAAQKISAELMREIQKLGLETTATTDSLVEATQSIMGPALQAGMALKDIPKFAVAGAQALQTLGVPLEQARTELEALLSGTVNKAQDILAPKLFADIKGDIGDYIKGLREAGTLQDELMRRLEPFALAGQDVAQTWSGLVSNLEEAMDTLAGQSAEGLTSSLKESVKVLQELLLDSEGDVGISADFRNIAEAMREIESAIGEGILGAVRTVAEAVKSMNAEIGLEGAVEAANRLETALKGVGIALAAFGAAKTAIFAQGVMTNAINGASQAMAAYRQATIGGAEAARLAAVAERERYEAYLLTAQGQRQMLATETTRMAMMQRQAQLANAVAAAEQRLVAAQNMTKWSAAWGAATASVSKGLQGIISLLGGPLGAAMTAMTVAVLAIATAKSDSEKATEKLTSAEKLYADAMKGVTDESGKLVGKLDEVRKAKLELSKEKLELGLEDMKNAIQHELLKLGDGIETGGWWAALAPNQEVNSQLEQYKNTMNGLFGAFKAGSIDAEELSARFSEIYNELDKSDPALKSVRDLLRHLIEQGTLDDLARLQSQLNAASGQLGNVEGAAYGAAEGVRALQQQAAQGFVFDTSSADKFIADMEGKMKGLRMEAQGLGAVSSLAKLFPNEDAKTLKAMVDAGRKKDRNAIANLLNAETSEGMRSAGDYEKAVNSVIKASEYLSAVEEKGSRRTASRAAATRSGASAARQAANAQIDYKSSIEKTRESIEALEEQVKLDKTEELTRKKIEINKQYEQSLIAINKEYEKSANKKGVSGQQAQELKQLKEKEALLKKEVQLRELEEKQIAKNVEKARGQISFYKELGKLSGQYINDLELQETLIEAQADNYRKSLGVSEELIQQWVAFSKLQISTDPFDGAYRGLIRFANEFEDQGKVWENISYNFAKGFVDATGDMFDEFLETGKISFSSFERLFRDLLKQLAYQALIQPIMVNIVGGITGALGLGGGSAMAGTGGIAGFGGLATGFTGASGGSMGGQLVSAAGGMAQQYGMKQLFSSGGFLGGIADSINATAAGWFPTIFASGADAGANAAVNSLVGEITGTAGTLPTSTFLGSLAMPGLGAGIGGALSPFVNNLIGIENNEGSSWGSMAGGLLGTVGGAFVGGPIGAIIGGLGSILGGGIGSLFGGKPKQEPKLEMHLQTAPWNRQDKLTWRPADGATAYGNMQGVYVAAETTHGASGQNELADSLKNIVENVNEQSMAIGEALGQFDSAMQAQYMQSLQAQGMVSQHAIHRGGYINEGEIQNTIDAFNNQVVAHILTALGSVDLTPVTIAADGMAADTAEELGEALNRIFSFMNITEALDEGMADKFAKGAQKQMEAALDNLSLRPLSRSSQSFAEKAAHNLDSALLAIAPDLGREGAQALGEGVQKRIDAAFGGMENLESLIRQGEGQEDLARVLAQAVNDALADVRPQLLESGGEELAARVGAAFGSNWSKMLAALNGAVMGAVDQAAYTLNDIQAAVQDLYNAWASGNAIANEELRASYQKWAVEEISASLADVSLAPLTIAADGFAVKTVDELAASLQDIFSISDIIGQMEAGDAQTAIASWFQQQVVSAFQGIDLSFLRVNFEQTTYSGIQKAYAAVQAWQQVQSSIDAVLNPVSEFDAQMRTLDAQFDQWIATLRELGWQEQAIMEVESRRAAYMAEQQRQMEESMRQSLALRMSAATYGSGSSQYQNLQMQFSQANELESAKKQFGENHPLYQQLLQVQAAERQRKQQEALAAQRQQLQAQLDQKLREREQLLAQQRQQAEAAARQAEQDRLNRERQNLQARQKAIQEEISARNKEMQEAQKLADTFRRLEKSLEKYRKDLWSGEDNLVGNRYAEAYRQFNDLYEKALRGDEEAFNEITGKAGELLQLGREQLPERGEYNDLFYEVDQKLKKAQEYARQQANIADIQVQKLQGIIDALERNRASIEASINALGSNINAVSSTVASVGNTTSAGLSAIDADIRRLQSAIANLGSGSSSGGSTGGWTGGTTTPTKPATPSVTYTFPGPINDSWRRPGNTGVYGSHYDSEGVLLSVMFQAAYQRGYKGRKNWTAKTLESDIISDYGSVQNWYNQVGKAAGYARGGITPANKVFMVGEKGPELMTSPARWGVLSNEASRALAAGAAQAPRLEAESLAEMKERLAELISYMKQALVKLDSIDSSNGRMLNLERGWDAEGLPPEREAA